MDDGTLYILITFIVCFIIFIVSRIVNHVQKRKKSVKKYTTTQQNIDDKELQKIAPSDEILNPERVEVDDTNNNETPTSNPSIFWDILGKITIISGVLFLVIWLYPYIMNIIKPIPLPDTETDNDKSVIGAFNSDDTLEQNNPTSTDSNSNNSTPTNNPPPDPDYYGILQISIRKYAYTVILSNEKDSNHVPLYENEILECQRGEEFGSYGGNPPSGFSIKLINAFNDEIKLTQNEDSGDDYFVEFRHAKVQSGIYTLKIAMNGFEYYEEKIILSQKNVNNDGKGWKLCPTIKKSGIRISEPIQITLLNIDGRSIPTGTEISIRIKDGYTPQRFAILPNGNIENKIMLIADQEYEVVNRAHNVIKTFSVLSNDLDAGIYGLTLMIEGY